MNIVEGLLTAQSWVLFDKTVLVSNVDASSGGNTFNKSSGFTAAADSVLILYMDFTFTGNNGDGSTYNNNTLCVGRNPDAWNDTACRLYMGSDPNGQGHGEQILLVGFDDAGQQYIDAPGGTIKRNRAVMRISYTNGTMDFWQKASAGTLLAARIPVWAKSTSPIPRALTGSTAPTMRSADWRAASPTTN